MHDAGAGSLSVRSFVTMTSFRTLPRWHFITREPFACRRLLTGAGGVPALSQATDKIPTYVVGLEARLSGGIPRGHIVLVGGPPGSLKSSFVYRILFNEAKERAASGLYLSME